MNIRFKIPGGMPVKLRLLKKHSGHEDFYKLFETFCNSTESRMH